MNSGFWFERRARPHHWSKCSRAWESVPSALGSGRKCRQQQGLSAPELGTGCACVRAHQHLGQEVSVGSNKGTPPADFTYKYDIIHAKNSSSRHLSVPHLVHLRRTVAVTSSAVAAPSGRRRVALHQGTHATHPRVGVVPVRERKPALFVVLYPTRPRRKRGGKKRWHGLG